MKLRTASVACVRSLRPQTAPANRARKPRPQTASFGWGYPIPGQPDRPGGGRASLKTRWSL